MNNYILIVLDSCRYDSFIEARPRHLPRLGAIERRWSYASWTSPSHYNLLSGLMPHCSPPHVFASTYYRKEFLKFNERLGSDGIEFKSLVPKLYLPAFLREKLGYRTHARVSMPVLNPRTILNHGFDTYELMERHNDARAIFRKLTFVTDQPTFYLLNIGETHYPYALADEPSNQWPRLSGVHGVFRDLDDAAAGRNVPDNQPFFDGGVLTQLRHRQVAAVRYIDDLMEELFDIVPRDTYVTVTSDHGELFGEDGYFGHGPIQHEKVFEVPLVEGKIR